MVGVSNPALLRETAPPRRDPQERERAQTAAGNEESFSGGTGRRSPAARGTSQGPRGIHGLLQESGDENPREQWRGGRQLVCLAGTQALVGAYLGRAGG